MFYTLYEASSPLSVPFQVTAVQWMLAAQPPTSDLSEEDFIRDQKRRTPCYFSGKIEVEAGRPRVLSEAVRGLYTVHHYIAHH